VARFGVVHQIWRTRQTIIFFQISDTGCHWAFAHCHVSATDWATWNPPIWPCHPLLCQPTMSVPCHRTDATSLPHTCHIIVRISMWKNLISPRIGPEVPNLGDTWQPLVLQHHHVDVNMTHFTSYSYHMCCMDVDVICTNVDSSPS
jgi:hypothetical protein